MIFGLFGNKEHKAVADKIGVEIHRQLFAALNIDEPEASSRISSAFIVGYLYGFVRTGFSSHGYTVIEGPPVRYIAEELTDKYLKYICNGVLPGKLHNIFKQQMSALELAKELGKTDEIELFENGTYAGVYDAGVFSSYDPNPAENLFKFLTNEELDYVPFSE